MMVQRLRSNALRAHRRQWRSEWAGRTTLAFFFYSSVVKFHDSSVVNLTPPESCPKVMLTLPKPRYPKHNFFCLGSTVVVDLPLFLTFLASGVVLLLFSDDDDCAAASFCTVSRMARLDRQRSI